MLIVVVHIQGRNRAVAVRLQLRRELVIILWSQDLHRYGDVVDFLFGQERRMAGGDAVDEVFACMRSASAHLHSFRITSFATCKSNERTFATKLEDCPSAVAKANGAQLLKAMLRLQSFRAGDHFRIALLLAITIKDETLQVEILEFLWVIQRLGGHDLTAKANRM